MEPTLGELISKLRRKHGWNQGNMADDLAVSTATVSNWERDIRTPSYLQREALGRLLLDKASAVEISMWRRLADADIATPDDIIALLRSMNTPGLVQVVAVGSARGIGEDPLNLIRIGSRVKVSLDLPWRATVSIVNVDVLSTGKYACTCLDQLAGELKNLDAGLQVLPRSGQFPVGGVPGVGYLVMLARRDCTQFDWIRADPLNAMSLDEVAFCRALHDFAPLRDEQQAVVSTFEYQTFC